MSEVLIAIACVCGISIFLTLLILLVDATIGNYGECEVSINQGDKTLKVRGGQSLLNTLNSEGIFIPSACGGKGSCGLCKLKVEQGVTDYLPTELPWISEEEKKENIRLSCQIKVKNNLQITIPEEYFLVKEFQTVVDSIRDLTHDIKELRLRLKDPDTIEFKAGQFIQIKVPVYELTEEEVYRAYSIASQPSQKNIIELMIRLVPNGICTTYVHNYLKEGDELILNGPYGEFHLQDTEREIVCIAGGSGMAPIKSILNDMKEKQITRRTRYFFGAVASRDLFEVEAMKQLENELADFKFIPALSKPQPEDNWDGETGLITDVLDKHLDSGENVEAYLCGSPGMIDACIQVLTGKGVPEELIFYDKFA